MDQNELNGLNLNDSIQVRTGYDLFQDLSRYNVTPIGNDMYEVIDMGDETGYVAGDQFITPAWSLEWEGLKMDGLAGTHPLNK